MKTKRKALSDGLTIIEVIISMALFSIVATIFVSITSSAIRLNASTKKWNREIDYQAQYVETHDEDQATKSTNAFVQAIVFTPSTGGAGETINLNFYRYTANPDDDTLMEDPTQFKYFMPQSPNVEKGIYKIIIDNTGASVLNFNLDFLTSPSKNFILGTTGSTEMIFPTPVSSTNISLGAKKVIAVWVQLSQDVIDRMDTVDGTQSLLRITDNGVVSTDKTLIIDNFSPDLNSDLKEGVIWITPKAPDGVDTTTIAVDYD